MMSSSRPLKRGLLVFAGFLLSVTSAFAMTAPKAPLNLCAGKLEASLVNRMEPALRLKLIPCVNAACPCDPGTYYGTWRCSTKCDVTRDRCPCVLAGVNCADAVGRQTTTICNPGRVAGKVPRNDCKN